MTDRVVVLGGGQAGAQVVASLRSEGFTGHISLVSSESVLPYERPPLSKAYLLGKLSYEDLRLHHHILTEDPALDLNLGTTAEAIDTVQQQVVLTGGPRLGFDHLVLATGASNRTLRVPGADLAGVSSVRTVDDAAKVRAALEGARDVVVIGGGFLGLEIASVAALSGGRVTVVEAAERVLVRGVSASMAGWIQAQHLANGLNIRLGAKVVEIEGHAGQVRGVRTHDGNFLAADACIVCVGVVANDVVAAEAGLAVADGVLVDHQLRTSHPAIYAIGDCAQFCLGPAGRTVRLESVQNAVDQARFVARRIAGTAEPDARYDEVPWFWSDQGSIKLKMAGLSDQADEVVLRGDPESGKFSVFSFVDGALVAAESISRTADHMAARRLLARGAPLTPAQAADESFDVKAYAAEAE
jgi:3-phenylpropionate/trans-cinnamate dioxygenase ferredoxin reductase subunit